MKNGLCLHGFQRDGPPPGAEYSRENREGGRSQEFNFFCCVVLDKPSTCLARSFLVCEMIITYLIFSWLVYLLAWGWVT